MLESLLLWQFLSPLSFLEGGFVAGDVAVGVSVSIEKYYMHHLRGFGLVDKIWIKHIELVALHNLWWRVIVIIVSLIVLVPFVASVHAIEIPVVATES